MYRNRIKSYCDLLKPYFPKTPLTVDWIRNASRAREYGEPRDMVCALLHEHDFTLKQIAHAVGFKDHTSALWARRRAHEKYGRGLFIELAGRRRGELPPVPNLRMTLNYAYDQKLPTGYQIVETVNPEPDGGWTFTNGVGFRPTEPLRVAS
jgi:hypothetical protein